MSNLRNKVQLIGNIGNDVELKELDGGKKVANFSIATNDTYKNAQGEKVTNTDWHNCVAWGNLADILNKYTKKGSQIAIEGKLTYDKYEKEGVKFTSTKIIVSDVVLLDKKED